MYTCDDDDNESMNESMKCIMAMYYGMADHIRV